MRPQTRLALPMALVVALLAISVASPAAAAAPVPAAAATFRFTGHGTDHGVGLNQRGAAGRAKAGQTYGQILAHYFPRTKLGPVPLDTTIRALVVNDFKPAATETPLLRGQVTAWTIDSPAVADQVFPAHAVLVLIGPGASGAWQLQVRTSATSTAAPLADFTDDDADLRVRPVPPALPEDPEGDIQVLIRPSTTYGHHDTYRGTVRVGRKGKRIRVVNEVPIEPFVRSVTPRELGRANLQETLKTQAVAARSYFLAGLRPTDSWYDVQSYREGQSYQGIEGEDVVVNRAVDATAYEVLWFKGTTIVRAFYHAVGGGATEASANVFTDATGDPGAKTPYLPGGPDVDEHGVPYDVSAPAFNWQTRTFTRSQLSAILAEDSRTNVGELTAWPIESEAAFRARRAADPAGVAPSNRGVSGRLTWVILKGTKGKKHVAGWLFKSVFNAHRGSGDKIGSTMIFREAAP